MFATWGQEPSLLLGSAPFLFPFTSMVMEGEEVGGGDFDYIFIQMWCIRSQPN